MLTGLHLCCPRYNDQLKSSLSKVQDDLNPLRVLELFERITTEDMELLDCYYRPENLIMQDLPVPPVRKK
jgi:DNA-directed RNA polymerase III subunit RPC1